MHLTLKKEATKPAAKNFLQQHARFDKFVEVFHNERPHEALDMKCPAEVYRPSPRPYTGLPDIDYPLHDKTIVVTRCGRICLGNSKINFSQVFAGQAVGIRYVLSPMSPGWAHGRLVGPSRRFSNFSAAA